MARGAETVDPDTTKAIARTLPPGLHFTARRDAWFLEPLVIFVVLTGFIAFSIFRVFENAHYEAGNLLSPFYSPFIPEAWREAVRIPLWISPAAFILWAPAGFRLTCYYYRKSYYRSFALDPPGCAVRDPHSTKYRGESRFPFVLQNFHRYFLYAATLVVVFLWIDVVRAFIFDGRFGVSLGSLLFLVNTSLLTTYSLSCHSLRHLVGGRLDCFSCEVAGGPHLKAWRFVTRLNENHMFWAWVSLFSVAAADAYVRYVALGVLTDVRLI